MQHLKNALITKKDARKDWQCMSDMNDMQRRNQSSCGQKNDGGHVLSTYHEHRTE